MNRTPARTFAAALLAALLILLEPASAGGNELSSWFWFIPSDGTTHTVRARFNSLSAKWSDEGKFANWSEPPRAQRSRATEGGGFEFYNRDLGQPMLAGPLQYRIEGRTDDRDKVSELSAWIAPSGSADRNYLSGCEQLAQVITLSLFDKLSEKASRNVQLALLYDLRPFNYRDPTPPTPKERSLLTVVDGTRVALSWSMLEQSQMRLRANLQGPASGDEVAAAHINNGCNRLLSQSSTQCGIVRNSLRAMADHRAAGGPDWTELSAIAAQSRSALTMLTMLCTGLADHEKTAEYARELGNMLELEQAAAAVLQAAIDNEDAPAFEAALASAAALAQDAHSLIGMIRS